MITLYFREFSTTGRNGLGFLLALVGLCDDYDFKELAISGGMGNPCLESFVKGKFW